MNFVSDVARYELFCRLTHISWQLVCLNRRIKNAHNMIRLDAVPAPFIYSSTIPSSPGWLLCGIMPSAFSLETYTAMFSSILTSLSSLLHLPSDPPPYNHTQSSHHDYSPHKNSQCHDLLIPMTPSVLIHIPNHISYNPRGAHRRKRKTQSFPMVEIAHHKAVRRLTTSQ